jgi:hypothetical protein
MTRAAWLTVVAAVGVTALLLGGMVGAIIGAPAFPETSVEIRPSPSPVTVERASAACLRALDAAEEWVRRDHMAASAIIRGRASTARVRRLVEKAADADAVFHAAARECRRPNASIEFDTLGG